jgi:hypothetical protein
MRSIAATRWKGIHMPTLQGNLDRSETPAIAALADTVATPFARAPADAPLAPGHGIRSN